MNKKILISTMLVIFTLLLTPLQTMASFSDNSIIRPQSADTSIIWNVDSNYAKTRSVYLSEGTTITVTATIAPSKSKARIGIIDLDDTYNVKNITGFGSFSYTAPSSGTYKIYFKNTSSFKVTVGINYSFD